MSRARKHLWAGAAMAALVAVTGGFAGPHPARAQQAGGVAGTGADALGAGAQHGAAQLAAPTAEGAALPAGAQGILMLDWEQLYERSGWGRRVAREIAAESAALNAENTRIADDLIAEEKSLTERRASLPPAQFRAEAEAFDQRATGIRSAQKAKAQALSRRFEEERQAFIQAAVPLLDQLLASRGAAMVIDRRLVIRGLSQIDITDEMAALVDSQLGDGGVRGPVPGSEPAPETAPDTAP